MTTTPKDIYQMGAVKVSGLPVANNTNTNYNMGTVNIPTGNAGATTGASTNAGTGATTGATTGTGTGTMPDPNKSNIKVSDLYNSNPLDTAYSTAVTNASTNANQVIDENAIRAKALQDMQAEIDATNNAYASKLSSAKVAGANRLGQTTAIGARRGLLGSDFGQAQIDTTNSANTDIYNSIENERMVAVQNLMQKARDNAQAEIDKKTTAKNTGAENYIKYLAEQTASKEKNTASLIQNLIASNIDPSKDLDSTGDNSLEALAKMYGITASKVKADYTTAKKLKDASDAKTALENKKTMAGIYKDSMLNVGDGQQAYYVDPETGKVTMVANNPKSYAPKEGSGLSSLSPEQTSSVKTSVGNSLKYLMDNYQKAGSLNTNVSGKYLPFATEASDFVNQVENVKNKLLLADGADIKKLFGPQISNSDIYIMKTALTNLDPYKQTPQAFLDSLNEIMNTATGKSAISSAQASLPATGNNSTAPSANSTQVYVGPNGEKYQLGQDGKYYPTK